MAMKRSREDFRKDQRAFSEEPPRLKWRKQDKDACRIDHLV